MLCGTCWRFAEHLGLEPPDDGGALPRVHRQAGFVTGLREETFGIPAPLDGDLGEQQAAAPAALDEETMTADLDLADALDPLERPQNRELDVQIGKLIGGHWGEPG